MKNIILITADLNESYNFASTIKEAKTHIVEYFGKKYTETESEMPSVLVTVDITKEDINYINNLIGCTSIHLMVLLCDENSEDRIDGGFIDLR